LLLMFRHGLRVSEACHLVLSQVDIESRVLHVSRLKKGLSTTHPLRTDEIRTIKAWLADRAKMKPETDAFFVSARRGPLSRKTAWLAIHNYGELAGLGVTPPNGILRTLRIPQGAQMSSGDLPAETPNIVTREVEVLPAQRG
jgi:type 1 fimbriae regulatory protein FimB